MTDAKTNIIAIAVVGFKHTGKTTLAARLVSALTARGYRVAALKHDRHGFNAWPPGTDTAAFAAAGAVAVAIASSDGHVAIERRGNAEPSLSELLIALGDHQIAVVEGYKSESLPKIALLREEDLRGDSYVPPDYAASAGFAESVLGYVVPRAPLTVAGTVSKVYHRDDIEALVRMVEQLLPGGG